MTAEIRINIQGIIENINHVRRLTDKRIIFVVKGEVYGLGYPLISMLDQYVDSYATSSINEFHRVKLHTGKPVLILAPVPGEQVENDPQIVYSISSLEQLYAFQKHLVREVKCALKINTGLNRYGFDYRSDLSTALSIIKNDLNSQATDIYTHLAASTSESEGEQASALQYERLMACIESNGLNRLNVHYTDSAALVRHFDVSAMSAVRTGMTILGLNPVFGQHLSFDYGFPLQVNCRPTCISHVEQGEFYGYEKRAKESLHTMTINLGYCDGMRKAWIGHQVAQCGATSLKLLDVAMNSSIFQIPETLLSSVQLFQTRLSLVDSQAKLSYLADLAKTSIEDVLCGFNSVNIDKVYC